MIISSYATPLSAERYKKNHYADVTFPNKQRLQLKFSLQFTSTKMKRFISFHFNK